MMKFRQKFCYFQECHGDLRSFVRGSEKGIVLTYLLALVVNIGKVIRTGVFY